MNGQQLKTRLFTVVLHQCTKHSHFHCSVGHFKHVFHKSSMWKHTCHPGLFVDMSQLWVIYLEQQIFQSIYCEWARGLLSLLSSSYFSLLWRLSDSCGIIFTATRFIFYSHRGVRKTHSFLECIVCVNRWSSAPNLWCYFSREKKKKKLMQRTLQELWR